MISSDSNSQIKDLIRLQKQAKYRKKKRCFVAEGIKMLREAAAYGKLQKIYIMESIREKEDAELEQLLEEYPYEMVTDSVFRQMSETVTPQGILGLAQMPEYALEELWADERHRYLLLDDLRDPGNLGTILRTAEGAGMSGVILSRESVDLFNPKVVRSTMGAIFRVPFCYVESLSEVARRIRELGIGVYGTAMEGSVVYDEPDYTEGAGIVIGNEANGISDEVFREMTGRIRIPMGGRLESLNAAVAAAIVMYEMQRQERWIVQTKKQNGKGEKGKTD